MTESVNQHPKWNPRAISVKVLTISRKGTLGEDLINADLMTESDHKSLYINALSKPGGGPNLAPIHTWPPGNVRQGSLLVFDLGALGLGVLALSFSLFSAALGRRLT